ncbi:MAG: methyltransferase domain-containing protein [Crenarchaeota archaeon]|nr:methyltransferase domain-containing protein [Thermoproteota archaeon]
MNENNDRYSWDAADYSKNSSNQYEWAKEIIPKLSLNGTESLLDIGCGDGKVTSLISTYLPYGDVVGVDSSHDMIVQARRSYPQLRYPNLTFLKMDARELTFDGRFDVVFSNATLHWIIEHQLVLKGVYQSLDKNGRIYFQMAGKGNAQDVLDVLQEMISEESCKPYFKNFTFPYGFYGTEQYTKWLNEAGFRPDRVELIPKDAKFIGKDGLAGWIRTTWLPFTEKFPESLLDSLINEIAERYIEAYPPDNKGIIHVKMVRLEVQATKI